MNEMNRMRDLETNQPKDERLAKSSKSFSKR